MAELTQEQLEKAQTMSLDELRAAAIAEAAGLEVVETLPIDKSRDEKGRFKSNTDEETVDNSEEDGKEPPESEDAERTIYRKEIVGDDGQIEVFEADSLEELVEKIAEGKRHANKHLKTVLAEKHALEAKTRQVSADEEYVIAERLKTEPKKTVEELVIETIEKRDAKFRAGQEAQSRFVATHPDFIPNPKNGNEMQLEVQRLGYTEFTYEGLEKAYQSLKTRGILALKAEGSEEATDTKGTDTQRIVEPAQEVTQPRSQKKGSTLPSGGSRKAAPVATQPSEDEAYALPLDKLRELANKQLAERNAAE